MHTVSQQSKGAVKEHDLSHGQANHKQFMTVCYKSQILRLRARPKERRRKKDICPTKVPPEVFLAPPHPSSSAQHQSPSEEDHDSLISELFYLPTVRSRAFGRKGKPREAPACSRCLPLSLTPCQQRPLSLCLSLPSSRPRLRNKDLQTIMNAFDRNEPKRSGSNNHQRDVLLRQKNCNMTPPLNSQPTQEWLTRAAYLSLTERLPLCRPIDQPIMPRRLANPCVMDQE